MNPQEATARDHAGATARASSVQSRVEQVGTPCIDGTTLSVVDVERNAEKVAAQRETIRRAVYAVADQAVDASECRYFLDMIGISLASVRAVRESRSGT